MIQSHDWECALPELQSVSRCARFPRMMAVTAQILWTNRLIGTPGDLNNEIMRPHPNDIYV
jgi:hypothetical protein